MDKRTFYFQEELKSNLIFFGKLFLKAGIILAFGLLFLESFIFWQLDRLILQESKSAINIGQNELSMLRGQVDSFNSLIDRALIAKNEERDLAPAFTKLNSLLNSNLRIVKIDYSGGNSLVTLLGEAASESAVVSFKNSLEKRGFKNVFLPLAEIAVMPKGVSFKISFNLGE